MHEDAHHLDQCISAIVFIVWPLVVILSVWVLGFLLHRPAFTILSLLFIESSFSFFYFIACFIISPLTLTFKWGIRNSSSKGTVMRADVAPVGDGPVFLAQLSSARDFLVSPRRPWILDYFLSEIPQQLPSGLSSSAASLTFLVL